MFLNVLKFIVKSTNEHGVHSPFVFQMITKCMYVKSDKIIKKQFLDYKQKLESNTSTIEVLDLGFGSKKIKSKQRKVSKIAKTAATPVRYALLMNRIIKYLKVKKVLELGTSLGSSTYAFSLHNNLQIDTIEGCPQTLKIAKETLKSNLENTHVNFINSDFNQAIDNLSENTQYDLIFFDGNHQKEPTIEYFKKCLKHKHNDTVFVFDDIYWSKEMEQAWSFIKEHEEVLLTVDIFKFGFVFFRKEQARAKEHFKIRF